MKILMISLDRGLLGRGQLGDVVERHREYAKRVARLDIIVLAKTGYRANQLAENARVFPTSSLSRVFYFIDAYRIGKKLFTNDRYDLIVTQDPFLTGLAGYLLAKKFKAKLLVHFHGDFLENPAWRSESRANKFLLPLGKFIAKRADGLRAMSGGIREKLLRLGIAENKIRVISTPVYLLKFTRGEPVEVRKIKDKYQGKKIILFVGRLEKVKDFPTLVKALAALRNQADNFIALVLGEGSQGGVWRELADGENLKDEVDFIGKIEHGDLINYYHACDFLVNTSTNESFGKIFVEAAAAGKPSIATATTGAKEIIIDGQTGILVPIGDDQRLSRELINFLSNKELVRKLGEQARANITEKFSGAKNIELIIDYWKYLINEKK